MVHVLPPRKADVSSDGFEGYKRRGHVLQREGKLQIPLERSIAVSQNSRDTGAEILNVYHQVPAPLVAIVRQPFFIMKVLGHRRVKCAKTIMKKYLCPFSSL